MVRSVRLSFFSTLALSLVSLLSFASGAEVRLAETPALSPDGSRLVFSWRGDLWVVASTGGRARQLTFHPSIDRQPRFSPDGRRLAFVSDRTGSNQIHLMPAGGGEAQQLTFHTEGYALLDWYPDGEQLLVQAQRDHFWRHADRFYRIGTRPRSAETLLFDAAAEAGSLARDGKRIAFVREGTQWWRQGYRGSQAAQLWLFDPSADPASGAPYVPLVQEEAAARDPLWIGDQSLLYVSERSGVFQLWRRELADGSDHQLTEFETGVIWEPTVSADDKVAVFRQGFDLWRLDLTDASAAPQRLRIVVRDDAAQDPIVRRVLSEATDAAFTDDALEIALIAGGDLWVMDTELREPIRVTSTAGPESEPLFTRERDRIVFVAETDGQCDLWQAKRVDTNRPWWLNSNFTLERLTDDAAIESSLKLSPDGKTLAYVKGLGQLVLHPLDGSSPPRTLLEGWDTPSYDWAPDGRWIVYARDDDDFNRDVHLIDVAGERPPFNVSRHPDNEGNPVWSPDGRIIAFTGRRDADETDIHFVYLTREQDQIGERDRRLRAAIEKFEKERGAGSASGTFAPSAASPTTPVAEPNAAPATDPAAPAVAPGAATPTDPAGAPAAAEPGNAGAAETPAAATTETRETPKPDQGPEPVKIDFDDLAERIRTVSIPNSSEGRLFWSADSKTLAFTARIDGRAGLYGIRPDEKLEPTLLTELDGSSPRWLPKGNRIAWLVGGTPATFDTGSKKAESYGFSARHDYDRREKFRTAFVLAWREMRDTFYDGTLNHRNWDEIRRRYEPMAAEAIDERALAVVVNLMLGELNGSHLGFSIIGGRGRGGERGDATRSWTETTAHLGVRFDLSHPGPGLKIRDVIVGGPADLERSRLAAGETILAIDGTDVDPAMDLTSLLNGPLDRTIRLKVAAADGTARDVELRPTTYGAIRSALYDDWVRDNERKVEELSGGRLGYLHIQGMNQPSFLKFERQLYAVGAGKEGLVIDVRENGGGSTADHLLTALTQPVHAMTIPRGGGIGYPQDRKIYATWNKPIIVLCNQNSFSNAEIFSHAIKVLGRGRLVGVTTAGGVISTGGTQILDIGTLRKPFRGWYRITDGEDMELNGAVPDALLWPAPGDWPAGIDTQLETAVRMLEEDVAADRARPRPTPRNASERRAAAAASPAATTPENE